jgi:hypothetical protein
MKKKTNKLDSDIEKASAVIALIAEHAMTDTAACKQMGFSRYKFWGMRRRDKSLADDYESANECRAQTYIDEAEQLLKDVEKEITCDNKSSAARVNLARYQYACKIKYAAMTDRKKWSDKTDINITSNTEGTPMAVLIEKGVRCRDEKKD